MNYITPEQIKEYVSKHPEGIAGNSKELSEMVNYFAELIVREYSYDCMDVTSNSEHIQFVAKKWGVEI